MHTQVSQFHNNNTDKTVVAVSNSNVTKQKKVKQFEATCTFLSDCDSKTLRYSSLNSNKKRKS